MRFVERKGNEAVLSGLWRAAREGRLPHALCFTGPEGVGKFLAAEELAAGLLCATARIGPPCGTCGPCKRLRTHNHPDVFVVDPTIEGLETIPIGYVTPREGGPERTIEQFLALRAMEGGWRVVLLREADRLVEQAQNALLKTLEEPGRSTLLVLETARPDRLLPTIHSRCVRVPFRALSSGEVRDVLEKAVLEKAAPESMAPGRTAPEKKALEKPHPSPTMSPARIAALARWSQGAPGIALALSARGAVEMRALIETVLSSGSDPHALAREAFEIDADFPGPTPTARARLRARTMLDLCADVLRDALRARAGLDPDDLAHGDLAERLAPLSEAALASSLERILAARQDVDANLAPDAAVERALLALEALHGAPAAGASRR